MLARIRGIAAGLGAHAHRFLVASLRLRLLRPLKSAILRCFGLDARLPLVIGLALIGASGVGMTGTLLMTGGSVPAVADGYVPVSGEIERDSDLAMDGHIASGHESGASTGSGTGEAAMLAGEIPAGASADPASLPLVPPQRLVGVDEDGPLPPSITTSLSSGHPPVQIDPEMTEQGIYGRLPARGADGREPRRYYAAPTETSDNAPGHARVAIIIMDLGLNTKLSADSTMLPDAITLGFSPYMGQGAAWHRYARGHGHETMLRLPVNFPANAMIDEGPLAIDPRHREEDMPLALERILSRASGYVALAGHAGSFARQPDAFAPIARELARRGIGFVELGSTALASVGEEARLAYASASIALDGELSIAGIDAQLAALESQALTHGQAIGYTIPYPLVFDRIWQWSRQLNPQIELVPASALLGTTQGNRQES